MTEYRWDVFISHATEDKDEFVRPLARELARELARRELRIWFDEHTLKMGDSLRKSIAEGVAASRFGVVVLSPHFFKKEWPQRELQDLSELEVDGRKVILPVWHGVDYKDVHRFSPRLADRLAGSSEKGLGPIVDMIVATISPNSSTVTWTSTNGRETAVRAASRATGRDAIPLLVTWASREGDRNTFMVRFHLSSAFGSTRIFQPPEVYQNSQIKGTPYLSFKLRASIK